MKWFYPVVIFSTVLLSGTPAIAQNATPTATGPIVNRWYAGITTGVAVAEKTGGQFAGEAGIRVMRNLDVSLEFGWFQNVTNQQRLDSANTIAGGIQNITGQATTGTVSVPAIYTLVNARYVFESERRYRPYAMVGLGGARLSPDSTFVSGGTDISDSVDQVGVTLGLDLSGHKSHPAFTGGAGVLLPFGKWYGDVGYRLTNIRTDGEATNVNRITFGMGARF